MTIDKNKYYKEVNGIGDWVAYAIIDPERGVPDNMKAFYQEYSDEGIPLNDLTELKVVDICWSTQIAEQTVVRLGSLTHTGTIINEDEFDKWLSCVHDGEETTLMTHEGYESMVLKNKTQ